MYVFLSSNFQLAVLVIAQPVMAVTALNALVYHRCVIPGYYIPVITTAVLNTARFYPLWRRCREISSLQQIQNSFARTVVKAPKSCHNHSHPTLSPLAPNHWTHRIRAFLSYLKSSHNYQPPCLYKLIFVQRPRSTRSASVVTLARSPSSLWSLFSVCLTMSRWSTPSLSLPA